MARDKAYQAAEEKIEKARRTGATELNLSCSYNAKDSEKLTALPESLGRLTVAGLGKMLVGIRTGKRTLPDGHKPIREGLRQAIDKVRARRP